MTGEPGGPEADARGQEGVEARGGRRLPGVGADPDELRRGLDAEIEAHLRMRAEDLEAGGMSPDEAWTEALRRFGDLEDARRNLLAAARRRARHRRVAVALAGLRRDLAHAARRAGRAPGFTALVVAIFGLGVGLTTSMFTLTDHVLLQPLPFPRPDELVALGSKPEKGPFFYRVSMGNWVDWRRSPALASTGLYRTGDVTITGEGDAFRASLAEVVGGFFETLRSSMASGRPFSEDEAQDRASLVVISDGFWRRVLGADPHVVGRTLTVNGDKLDVVGVVRRGQGFPEGTDLWLPTTWRAEAGAMRNNVNWIAIARLAPGVTPDGARQQLASIAAGIRQRDPESIYSWGVGVRPLHDFVTGDSRPYLKILMAAVLLVLLAACANLAGLDLARSRRRAGEIAVRVSLGATRADIVLSVLMESTLQALVGGILGLALARWGTELLLRHAGGLLPRLLEINFDSRAVTFGLAATLVSAVLTGFGPALRASAAAIGSVDTDARGSVQGGRGLPGSVMVGVEVAMAVSLLVGGTLLLRSFLAAASRPLGYDPHGAVTMDVILTAPRYRGKTDVEVAYWEDLMRRARGVPGVSRVAVTNAVPTGGGGTSFIDVEGSDDANAAAGYRVVSDDYFAVLGIPVLAGRTFDVSDEAGSERVGLVNESFAKRFWPGQSPLGKRFRAPSMEAYPFGGRAPWVSVIGVVGDIRQYTFEDAPRPDVFVLYRQIPFYAYAMTAVARLLPGGSPHASDALGEVARSVDPNLAVAVRTLESRVHHLLDARRTILLLVGIFTAVAVVLVSLGIYGLVSFAVTERTREIAVRAALGLDRGGILTLMLGSAVRVSVVGAAVGLVAAFGLGRLLKSLLLDVRSTDPLSYTAAALLLLAVTLVAAFLPSLRAARLDPVEALRRD